MWSVFPLVCRRPVNPNQGCGLVWRRGWFAKQCTSKGQTGCAAVLKGTALARANAPKGVEVLGMWQIETRAPGGVCVFLFLIRRLHRYSKLQPSPLHHLMCDLPNHLMLMFSFCLPCAASRVALKATRWCVSASFYLFNCKIICHLTAETMTNIA